MALPSQSQPLSAQVPLKHFRIHRAVPMVTTAGANRTLQFQLSNRSFSPLAVACSHSSLTSTVGSPPAGPVSQWTFGPRHILLLNVTACVVAISSTWLFLAAIPTLLAFRKTLESVEKLLEVTAEELPDTMASVRLSGMEISDLTRELSDLGEEITEGVRTSTRPLRVAGDRFHQLTTMNPKVMMQGQNGPIENTKRPTPPVAKAARELREGISRSRETFDMVNSVVSFSRWVFRGGRKKQK